MELNKERKITPMLPDEKETIQMVLDKKKTVQNSRTIQERQWLTNIAFLYGKQHFDVSQTKIGSGLEERIMYELKDQQRKNSVKRVSNYILPLYRSLLARLLKMKANTSVEPTTSDEKDKAAARVSREVIEDHWQMVNKNNPLLCQKASGMVLILKSLFSFVLTCGKGYLHPIFNKKTISKTYLANSIAEAKIGEVETHVISPFNLFEDRLGMFKIEQIILPIEIIKEQYGVTVDKEPMGMTDVEQQLLNMLEGGSGDAKTEDAAKVYKYWEVPTEKHPEGRFIILTANKLILDTVIPPEYKKKIPYFGFDYLDIFISMFPQGMIDQLISLQEEYNFTITKLHSYKKFFAGKVKVPKNCKLETKYNDEIGQIVYYEQGQGEPHFEVPPNPPTFLMEELARIRKDMEDVAAVHDAQSQDYSQIRSGAAIENLNELDNSQLGPVLVGIEQQLAFYAETVLDITRAKYTEPRLLATTGEQLSSDVKTFIGKDTVGNHRIKISLGSSLPASKGERQAYLMGLADKGFITKEKALKLMEFSDVEGIFEDLDENAQKIEIGEMLKGIIPQVENWDDHTIHLKVISDYLKGQEFKKLPLNIQTILITHRQQHQEELLQEMNKNKPPQQEPPAPLPAGV